MTHWYLHAQRAADMGFDWFYVNPVHFPGFSGSCYAIKDPYRIDPLLLPEDHLDANYDHTIRDDGGVGVLSQALKDVRAVGLNPMIDLVINHTSIDCPLVDQHPDWYLRDAQGAIQAPTAIDPADARRVTRWGDLAQFDHANSPGRAALRNYWLSRVETYVRLGFNGFRCDAAYKVPCDLWSEIITAARRIDPQVIFLAETSGARLPEIKALLSSGMDFLTNSSKYWQFDQEWFLEQQAAFATHTRSISFPESHDTQRLWSETGGNEAVQKQRYAFAAATASGVMMPIGYEFGFERPLHVVETRSEDWEPPRAQLENFIRRVHAWCARIPAFFGETLEAVTALDQPSLILGRRNGKAEAFIVINKDWSESQTVLLPLKLRGKRRVRICRPEEPQNPEGAVERPEDSAKEIVLQPAEVVYLI